MSRLRDKILYPLTLTLSPTLRAVERGTDIFIYGYFTQWVSDFKNKKA
jgi:hypothetical protein